MLFRSLFLVAGRPRPRRSAWRQGIGSPRLKDRRPAPCGPVRRKPSRLATLRRLRCRTAVQECSTSGANTGAGGAETGPVNFREPRREGPRSAAEWSAPLETKFLRFWVGHEQDSVLLRHRPAASFLFWCAGEVGGTTTARSETRAHDQWLGQPTTKATAATPSNRFPQFPAKRGRSGLCGATWHRSS